MSALPGVGGHLLSSTFIAEEIAALVPTPEEEHVRRELIAWRAGCSALGPASTPRTLLEVAAAPLFALLEFDRPSNIEFVDDLATATLRCGDRSVAVVVTTWGSSIDSLWRVAVTHAGRCDAAWSLLFDGRRL